MTNNALRTILGILAAVAALMGTILGCSTDAAGTSTCTASWLSPQMAGYAIMLFSVVALLLKAARPGGWLAGLFGATAVVINTGGVGTVTKAQVNQP